MKSNKLYRGDKIQNMTMPERYRSSGIISKLINGGNPAYIQRQGLINAISAHTNPRTKAEKYFLDKSEFISFTEDKNIALNYCSYNAELDNCFPNELLPCDEYFETRYIFCLDIYNIRKISFEKSIYLLTYKCNPELRKSDSLNEGIIEAQREFGWYNCEVCKRNELHKMYLINN
jgi:hypothetical protein